MFQKFVLALRNLATALRETWKGVSIDHALNRDTLTCLYNKKAVLEYLKTRYKKCNRDKLSVVYVDLDNLKIYNDTYGHAAADAYIKRFSERMSHYLRLSKDKVIMARLQGDEFLLVFEISETNARRAMQRVFDNIELEYPMSYGVAGCHRDRTIDEVIDTADRRMYDHKRFRKELREKGIGKIGSIKQV